MNKKIRQSLSILISLLLSVGLLVGCTQVNDYQPSSASTIVETQSYTSKDEVASYIHQFQHLPPNYITKKEAMKLGWKTKGTLDQVAPGKSIGGDYFGNYEKKLPVQPNRQYRECDIDYQSGNRNSKRIIYSNDGNIYYTADHYKTFEHLYGDDK